MRNTALFLIASAMVGSAAAASAQDIPEISARCQTENARMSALIQAQCLPLGSVAAKLSCAKQLRVTAHADADCAAKSRAHLVALQHACLSRTAPDRYERSGVCTVARAHPTAFAH
jgi:hypothetical protein